MVYAEYLLPASKRHRRQQHPRSFFVECISHCAAFNFASLSINKYLLISGGRWASCLLSYIGLWPERFHGHQRTKPPTTITSNRHRQAVGQPRAVVCCNTAEYHAACRPFGRLATASYFLCLLLFKCRHPRVPNRKRNGNAVNGSSLMRQQARTHKPKLVVLYLTRNSPQIYRDCAPHLDSKVPLLQASVEPGLAQHHLRIVGLQPQRLMQEQPPYIHPTKDDEEQDQCDAVSTYHVAQRLGLVRTEQLSRPRRAVL